jgi:hypothetical protein
MRSHIVVLISEAPALAGYGCPTWEIGLTHSWFRREDSTNTLNHDVNANGRQCNAIGYEQENRQPLKAIDQPLGTPVGSTPVLNERKTNGDSHHQ